MALTDELNDQETSQPGTEDNGSRRKMMEFILRSALKPSIPALKRGGSESPDSGDSSRAETIQPGTRGYDLAVGATAQPNVPTPKMASNEPPTVNVNNPPNRFAAPVLGNHAEPARPDVQPMRSDFAPKSELSGWKKYLGLGLSALAGPNAAPLAEKILHGQRDESNRQYGQAVTDWEREQTDKARQATTEETSARAYALRHPQPKEGLTPEETTMQDLMTGNKGQPQINPDTGKPYTRLEAYSTVQGAKQGAKPAPTPNEKEKDVSDYLAANNLPNTPGNREKARNAIALRGKDTTGRDEARGDRSYQWHAGRIDKLREPIEARAERISRLEDTLNQNSPQADALVAPELLSVMAGGQGSGLRMNEAEISRIVGGRTNWESIKAKLGAWQLDPSKGFALTPDQRQQTRQLFSTIKDRVGRKTAIINEESEALSGTDSAAEHRRIYSRLQQRLSQIDSGAGAGGSEGSQGGGPKVGDIEGGYRFKGGDPSNKANWEKANAGRRQ